MNSTTRTLQLGKEVAKFWILSEFFKIKSDMQKMNREQFFIFLSTGGTGRHQSCEMAHSDDINEDRNQQ